MQKIGFGFMLVYAVTFLVCYTIGFFWFWIQNTLWDAIVFLILYGFGFVFLSFAAELVSQVLPRFFTYFCALLICMFFCCGIPSISSDLARDRAAGLIAEYPDDKQYHDLWKEMVRNDRWQTLDDVKAAQKRN